MDHFLFYFLGCLKKLASPCKTVLLGIIVSVCLLSCSFLKHEEVSGKVINDFGNFRGISVSLYKRPTRDDFIKLERWGVNFVRLLVHADPAHSNYDSIYMPDGTSLNESAFQNLDRVIALALEHHIKVDICLMTFPGVVDGGIWRDYRCWNQLQELWSFMANRYRKSPSVVAYELMNEPRLVLDEGSLADRNSVRFGPWIFPNEWKDTPKDFFALVERLGQTINRVDAEKVVIVPVIGNYGSPINFNWMRPVDVKNVVYTFHMYIPYDFGDSGKRKGALVSYDSKKSRAKVIEGMEPARRFAEKYNAKIFVGEFGLLYHTEGMGAGDWMRDVMDYIEQNGWTWAYWSYNWRSPEMVSTGEEGILEKREDTERLTALKQYWRLNLAAQDGIGDNQTEQ